MNYIVYKNASEMMKAIIKKSQLAQEDKSKTIFSEMIIIIDNESIFDQIDEIRHQIDGDNDILSSEYYIPFILIISPRDLDLKGFKKNKTFKYDIYLEDILKLNNNTSKERKDEIFKFFRKINVIFSYYNELGDEFSFTNSEGEDIIIKLEDSNSPVNMNILLLGESGAGKSTLLNLIVGEKKSLEGGNGFSTTSKKILVFKKENVSIKLYDVKGIEDNDSLNNYSNILNELNGNIKKSLDSINAIFFCISYKTKTIMLNMNNKIFEKLIDFNVPILFIITSTPYDIREKTNNKMVESTRKNDRNKIKAVIHQFIKDAFIKRKKEKES